MVIKKMLIIVVRADREQFHKVRNAWLLIYPSVLVAFTCRAVLKPFTFSVISLITGLFELSLCIKQRWKTTKWIFLPGLLKDYLFKGIGGWKDGMAKWLRLKTGMG